MEQTKWDSLLFNEWTRLADLAKVLEPFKKQTKIMQQDSFVLSNVIPCILELVLQLQDTSRSTGLPRACLDQLLIAIRSFTLLCITVDQKQD